MKSQIKWKIPAKTFLLGEYAAIAQESAIVLTTQPYFELSFAAASSDTGIHPDSPAGLWLQKKTINKQLSWHDPYAGKGGLGASSAQFLSCYLATCHEHDEKPDMESMLSAYYESSWSGKGLKPSGYDVIAQAHYGCVYINRQKEQLQCYNWPFDDLAFLLLHTGIKLATHHHLQEATLPAETKHLSEIVDAAKEAFEQSDSAILIKAINDYHQALKKLDLVAQHSLDAINVLQTAYPEIVAIKGCGAMGSDILLVLVNRQQADTLRQQLTDANWLVLASEAQLTKEHSLFE